MTESPDQEQLPNKNTVSLLQAVLSISQQEGLEAIAYETCKQIVNMMGVFTVSIIRVDLETRTGKLMTEYISEDRVTDQKWFEPISYAKLPNFARVIEGRKTFHIHKDDSDSKMIPEMIFFDQFQARQIVIVPILARNTVFGMMLLWDRYGDFVFTEEDIAFLELLANNVGIIVERAQLMNQSERRASELESLHDISLALAAQMKQEELLDTILDSVFKLGHEVICVGIYMKKDGVLITGASRNIIETANQSKDCPGKSTFADQVFQSGKTIIIDNAKQSEEIKQWFPERDIEALVGMPLQVGNETLGVLEIGYQFPKIFSKGSIQILEMLADRAGMSMKNIQLLDEITHQALTDPLTGVANRRAFNQRLEQEISRARRNKSDFCLLFVDIDGFKQVNDEFGHPVGDQTLQEIVECMMNSIRESDVLARLGGDEFAILLPETGSEGGEKVSAKIRKAVAECKFHWAGQPNKITLGASVGKVLFPEQADTITTLYKIGDLMLYENKSEKNGFSM